jgi:hypothetical protein
MSEEIGTRAGGLTAFGIETPMAALRLETDDPAVVEIPTRKGGLDIEAEDMAAVRLDINPFR